MTTATVPEHLKRLPTDRRGLPVPWIAAWSSEHWAVARFDPLVSRQALFTAGRHGRGTPCFDVMNEPRQREAVMRGWCQVCRARLARDRRTGIITGYLPASTLAEGVAHTDDGTPVTAEPLLCGLCATYVVDHCCVLAKRGDPGILAVSAWRRLLQFVDPSAAPPTHERRFDRSPDLTRLGVFARRHGGLVGMVKLMIDEATAL